MRPTAPAVPRSQLLRVLAQPVAAAQSDTGAAGSGRQSQRAPDKVAAHAPRRRLGVPSCTPSMSRAELAGAAAALQTPRVRASMEDEWPGSRANAYTY